MTLRDFFQVVRTRWVVVAISTLIMVLLAVGLTLSTTPLYRASTRLFVSTPSGASVSDLYNGNRFSQERVKSYAQLLTGETLAQRTVEKLGLDISPKQLAAKVKATSVTDTVLVDVTVMDASPVRARDIANALSDEFVVMARDLETPTAGARPEARVIVEQRATIPSEPALPRPKRNIAMGLLAGLMLGIGLAVLRDRLDNTIKTREALEDVTHTGVVGSIPVDKERRRFPAISFEKDSTAIAEAFRKLRTNLQFLSVDDPARLIVITSSVPSEGKSTTAINIALALAETEQNVLLVDGDMRRPSLGKYLDLIDSVGFSTVLSGGATLDEVIQQTKYPNLTVLTAGAKPPNPSELLGSNTAKRVLSELREQFDYVIIDSSPLLAVTDGAILSANADGALLVCRFGLTKREQLAHSADILRNVGATLLGAVMSLTPIRGHAGYGYNYGYNYGYGYGYGSTVEPTHRSEGDRSAKRLASSSAADSRNDAEALVDANDEVEGDTLPGTEQAREASA